MESLLVVTYELFPQDLKEQWITQGNIIFNICVLPVYPGRLSACFKVPVVQGTVCSRRPNKNHVPRQPPVRERNPPSIVRGYTLGTEGPVAINCNSHIITIICIFIYSTVYIFISAISYHIISYHIISYHIISYHIISYHIISYHIISYHIISYHIISISISISISYHINIIK